MIDKSDCIGCHNDVYNHGFAGVKECWSFKTAKLVRKLDVAIDQRPPYDATQLVSRPECYRKPRFIRVDPASLTKEGFWK